MEITLMVLGIAFGLFCAFADTLGYGSSMGFGIYQIAGTIAGLIVALAGAWMKWGEQVHFPFGLHRPKMT